MSFTFRESGTSNLGEIDSQGQRRVTLYDAAGNIITPANRGSIPSSAGGILQSVADYKVARLMRGDETGTLRTSDEALMLYDGAEGAALDTNKWINTNTTHTVTQAAATGTLLNANSTVATTTGALLTSHRTIPAFPGAVKLFRARLRVTAHFANGRVECGFGNPGGLGTPSATAATAVNGAHWRKDDSGQWLPVLVVNGVEALGTPISNATFIAAVATTEYAIFVVELRYNVARFSIYKQDGTLVTSQDLEWSAGANFGGFSQTHLAAFIRQHNTGATGTAVQVFVDGVSVAVLDAMAQRPYNVGQAGMGYSSLTSPTAYTQNANWGNSAAPTTRTLSNTAAAETTLGGLLRANSIAGGNTDLIMFGWTNPSPYVFYCDGIWIPAPLNEVVAVATTATIFAYFASFNLSAVSLATGGTYPGHRIALPGIHTAAVGLAANNLFSGSPIFVQFPTPFAVMPGRFLHIGCRELVGTATATETYLWAGVGVSGFFE